MFRVAICFELSTCRFLSEFWSRVKSNPEMAINLGFEIDEYGTLEIPSYKTIWHFIKIRVGNEGMHELVDTTVKAVNEEGKKKGVTLGEDGVGLDACPLKAVDSDPDATYNGHYKVKGYFWHNLICLRHNLSLDYHATTITEEEGRLLAPMLYRIRLWGIYLSDIYVDGGYASIENIARIQVILKANADFDDMLLTLILAGQPKPVGAYYRNSILARYEECPEGYLDDYHLRNRVEGTPGVGKRRGC